MLRWGKPECGHAHSPLKQQEIIPGLRRFGRKPPLQ